MEKSLQILLIMLAILPAVCLLSQILSELTKIRRVIEKKEKRKINQSSQSSFWLLLKQKAFLIFPKNF